MKSIFLAASLLVPGTARATPRDIGWECSFEAAGFFMQCIQWAVTYADQEQCGQQAQALYQACIDDYFITPEPPIAEIDP